MKKSQNGYWLLSNKDIEAGTQYFFRLNDSLDRPDPASNYQPSGVHGPSEVIDHGSFNWMDANWSGVPLEQLIIYELHVGTFTREGTFEAIINRLDDIKSVGINAIEIMPVSQFPGKRNWGYDGTYPYAVQNSYGGPQGLKKLVNACHEKGISVVLDVVYNHLGPEGNYLHDYAPYFTDKYKTPWGNAINFDDEYSDEVRNYFIENALHWFEKYHINALRLDAIDTIYDMGAKHFLSELAERVQELNRRSGRERYLIAESDLNDIRVIQSPKIGGYGIHAQWSDDFHHSLHSLLTGEKKGYYMDFGKTAHLAKAINENFVNNGRYSYYRKRKHGNSAKELPPYQFVICAQNHDQIGNRMMGERLSQLVSFEAQKLTAGVLLLSPNIPLLFMGQEYGEKAPFLYFVDHGDENLIKGVQEGRKAEFREFNWQGEPPDPQSSDTFEKSILNWDKRTEGEHETLLRFNQKLLSMRKDFPALINMEKGNHRASAIEEDKIILMHRWYKDNEIFGVFSFNENSVELAVDFPAGKWRKILDSVDNQWDGPGGSLPDEAESQNSVELLPYNFAVYEKESH
jgi:maltooligosyltrehalose trehalohydrolase